MECQIALGGSIMVHRVCKTSGKCQGTVHLKCWGNTVPLHTLAMGKCQGLFHLRGQPRQEGPGAEDRVPTDAIHQPCVCGRLTGLPSSPSDPTFTYAEVGDSMVKTLRSGGCGQSVALKREGKPLV